MRVVGAGWGARGVGPGRAGVAVRAAGAAGPAEPEDGAPPPDLPASSAGKDSRSLRTTGGSIVELADRTNSPLDLR